MQGFTSRLEQRFQQRIADSSSDSLDQNPRFDLILWDHEISGPHAASVLIGFNQNLGVPKKSDIDQWIIKTTNAQMRIVPESVRLHPEEALIVAEVVKIPQKRPLEHKASMIAVTAGTFMDEKEALWEIRKSQDGNKYLARIEREDIDALLKEREKQTKAASVAARPKLAHLREAGIVDVSIGDHVVFLKNGKTYHGKVKSINGDKVKIALSDKEEEAMKADILDVRETTEEFKKSQREKLIDFFARAYGDKAFATELVDV